jgi:hypothetical protein
MTQRGFVRTRNVITESLSMDVGELVQRLRGVFLEDPGTRLTVSQVARLAGVQPSVCRNILEALADSYFLKLGRNGTFTLR